MWVLSADIGGTHSRLALVERVSGDYRIAALARYRNAAYDDFESLAGAFLREQAARPALACLGVAGPVHGDVARLTNLDWTLSATRLAGALGVGRVCLLNDLEALAWSLEVLPEDSLLTLHAGAPDAAGNRALIAAGTGLGEAGLYHDGSGWHPFATEGGHTAFAPTQPRDLRLLEQLSARFGRVSWERVLSGPGLAHLHECLLSERDEALPGWLSQQDAPARITRAALEDGDPRCLETLRWFARLYGAEAGDLALKHMARGGVYVGGGIAPRILPVLREGGFVEAFLDKGRMRPLLESMPLRVILDDHAALLGLGRYGFERAALT